jgi:glycosyltransferase involved in cell wall biosynthesis
VVLFNDSNRDMCGDLGPNVEWCECPGYTAHWMGRSTWELTHLSRLAAKRKCDFLFTPAGTVVPGFSLPQVSFAQNPWCLVGGVDRGARGEIKALLQRRAYRQAVNRAAMMVYNSHFMQAAYHANAAAAARRSEVVYQALDDSTFDRARAARAAVARTSLQVLSVSAWGSHKGAETVVRAIATVRERHRIPVMLVLAGSWPDSAYERRVRSLIHQLGMDDHVQILGYVSRDRLESLYAGSRVFTLMSHCESFGIPAVEAQAFGTPVVSSNCCAIPEICGAGGRFPEAGDAEATADALALLLEDEQEWENLSNAARENASRFRWDDCSRDLLKMFEVVH